MTAAHQPHHEPQNEAHSEAHDQALTPNLTCVSPKLAVSWLISMGVSMAVPLAGIIVGIIAIPATFSWLMWVALGVWLLCTVWWAVVIVRQVKRIGYALRTDDLLIVRGIMFRSTTLVPYGRLQFVDVSTGPIERALGISTVKLHTAAASTDASIPGIPAAQAARVRELLAARGEADLAGL